MTEPRTPSRQITDEVTAWPGVEAGPGRRGEFAFTVGHREIGHLHGDHAAHFSFPKQVWADLIENDDDVRDVIRLLRLNYDRVVARHGLPEQAGTVS
jgi:hypothetical protein